MTDPAHCSPWTPAWSRDHVRSFQREHNAGCTATRCLRTYSSRDVDEEKKWLFWTFKAKMLVLFKILYPPVFWWEAHRFKTGENPCVQHLPQFIIRTYASITYWERNIKLHWLCRNVLLLITLLGKKLCSWTRNPVFCWVSFLFFFFLLWSMEARIHDKVLFTWCLWEAFTCIW